MSGSYKSRIVSVALLSLTGLIGCESPKTLPPTLGTSASINGDANHSLGSTSPAPGGHSPGGTTSSGTGRAAEPPRHAANSSDLTSAAPIIPADPRNNRPAIADGSPSVARRPMIFDASGAAGLHPLPTAEETSIGGAARSDNGSMTHHSTADGKLPSPTAVEAQPDIVAREAEAHARAIEEMLAAQNSSPAERANASANHTPERTTLGPSPAVPTRPTADEQLAALDGSSGGTISSAAASTVDLSANNAVTTTTPLSPTTPPIKNTGSSSVVTRASDDNDPLALQSLRPIDANTAVSVVNTDAHASPPITDSTRPTADLPPGSATTEGSELLARVARRAREYPHDVTSQLDQQLALFISRQTVPRSEDLSQLPDEDREVIAAVIDGLVNFRATVDADNNALMNRKIRPLLDTADRLRTRAELDLPNALLCTEVKGFGLYTPVDPPRFVAGRAHRTIVYCEVQNFSSQLIDKGLWQTKLAYEIVLYTESGLNVWGNKSELTDTCRNRRHDFFLAKVIELPANLTLGRYVLKISVTDRQAKRVAETSIPVAIVAQ